MKRRYILLATLLTTAVVALAQYPDIFPRPYPDPYPAVYPGTGGKAVITSGTLTGTVTDSVWLGPLAGATVEIAGLDTLTCDASGVYTITNVPLGTYTLKAFKADYDTITTSVTLSTASLTTNFAPATYGKHVKGNIAANTTWTKANSPYRVDGNLTINGTTLLTIEPGVTVKFDSTASITASAAGARITAIGTEEDSILFYEGKVANWRGIIITAAPTPGDSLKYVRVSGSTKTDAVQDGGGLLLHASVKVDNSVVRNCSTTRSGGGTYGGTLTNCTITGNTATRDGGGAYKGTLTNCTISGNTAGQGSGGGTYGGTLTNCTISGNTTSGWGGGTYTSALTNCTITGNTAGQGGGGSYGGTLTNCTISGNTASKGGGSDGSTLTNCTVSGNTATDGGGTYNGTLTNCTVTGNVTKTTLTPNNIGNSTQWVRGSVIGPGGITFTVGGNDSLVTNSTIWGLPGTFTNENIPVSGNYPSPGDSAANVFKGGATTQFAYLLNDSVSAWVDTTFRPLAIGIGSRLPWYSGWRTIAYGQAQNQYFSLPGANLDSAVTYRIEGTIGTTTHPTYNAYTGQFTWTPEVGDIGEYPFVFWAKVGEDSISRPDTITVINGYTAFNYDADYTSFGDSADVCNAARDSMTVALWMTHDLTSTDLSAAWGKGDTTTTDLEWQIGFRDVSTVGGDSIRFTISGDGTTYGRINIPTPTTLTWHHYVLTYAAGTCSLYVDGVYTAGTAIGTMPATIHDGSGNMVIGAPLAATTRGMKGRVMMPVAYPKALTAAEALALYRGTYAGGESFKAGRGTGVASGTWDDESTNNFDGTHGTTGGFPSLRGHYGLRPHEGETSP